ncbi:MAG: UDP-N-acetylmuramoyl-L-alanyl-D-glutamate--2,6-diaminopimelate ligase [Candidatus Pacebacteria bacterium]|nr:UDP-N-acetylmuramoyl-L-alanyl-D-glutamate--2,6-diaminopimelate ligase [Candidatus Paceibacterota bacterium]
MDSLLTTIRSLIPRKLFRALQPLYHSTLATLGAVKYHFPSRKLYVVAVTGTKGKSTVTELISAILEEAGHTVALSNTIHFKVAGESEPNLYKMSMPGRFFMQSFLARAVAEDCAFAVLEMTSEGAKLNRHKHIDLDALVFTNLSPEHIESHGSFEAYRDAKLSLRDALVASPKPKKVVVANKDDAHGALFMDVPEDVETRPYSLKNAEPHVENDRGALLTFEGVSIHSPLMGVFNVYNILAAATFARSIGIHTDVIKRAIERLAIVKGRVEKVDEGQDFTVVVDYAHTPDSLEQFYKAFKGERLICVLGNCGGGRDTWKRPTMAKIAERYCEEVILTNEDPYDEDPEKIVREMVAGMEQKKPTVIMDRRLAIRYALTKAHSRDAVLITGKGTDPYIMGPKGSKVEWSDEGVVREELRKVLGSR